MSGTSMATPLVAGAIARGFSGQMTMQDAISKLVSTSAASNVWTGKVKSGGVIDLMKYLAP